MKKPSLRPQLAHLTRAIQAFRSLREEAPLHMVEVFLLVAQRNGIGAAEVGKLVGISPASVSRNVQALGRGKEGEPGLGVVTQIIDPKNPRAHSIRLTSKGKSLAKAMLGLVNEDGAAPNVPASRPTPEPNRNVHWQNWVD